MRQRKKVLIKTFLFKKISNAVMLMDFVSVIQIAVGSWSVGFSTVRKNDSSIGPNANGQQANEFFIYLVEELQLYSPCYLILILIKSSIEHQSIEHQIFMLYEYIVF